MEGDDTIPLVWAMVAAVGVWVVAIVIGGAILRAHPPQAPSSPEPVYEVIR